MSDIVMYDMLGLPLRLGDEVLYANGGRLWRGKLFSVSGPTCNSCIVTVPKLNGRAVTLQLRKSRIPYNIKLSQRKDIESGKIKISSTRLAKIGKGFITE